MRIADMKCVNCGSEDWTVSFVTTCDQCDSIQPKQGEKSQYCKDNMHLHCHTAFSGCDGCKCHDVLFRNHPFKESWLKENNITRYDYILKEKS